MASSSNETAPEIADMVLHMGYASLVSCESTVSDIQNVLQKLLSKVEDNGSQAESYFASLSGGSGEKKVALARDVEYLLAHVGVVEDLKLQKVQGIYRHELRVADQIFDKLLDSIYGNKAKYCGQYGDFKTMQALDGMYHGLLAGSEGTGHHPEVNIQVFAPRAHVSVQCELIGEEQIQEE